MTLPEVDELMELREWSRTDLASALDLCEAAVHKWFRLGKVPGGPGAILMRQWLDAAREEVATAQKSARKKEKQPV